MAKNITPLFTKRLNWKGFLIALVVVIGVELLSFRLHAIGGQKVSKPAEIPMSKWQTYVNPTMKLRMKLPPNWYAHDDGQTHIYLSYPIDADTPTIWQPQQEAAITIVSYPSNGQDIRKDAQNWIQQTNKANPGTFTNEIETKTVAGKNAVMLESASTHTHYLYVTNENVTYLITIATPVTDTRAKPPVVGVPFEKYQEMFDQMLGTLTFIQ